MTVFILELDRMSNNAASEDWTVWLHTQMPTDAAPMQGRTDRGGGAYEAGLALPAAGISDSVGGEVTNMADLDFGTADEVVGDIVGWSVYRGAEEVTYGALAVAVTINDGDSYIINAGTLGINGDQA